MSFLHKWLSYGYGINNDGDPFRTYHGPGVDSAPSENEYQEHFLGVKAAGA